MQQNLSHRESPSRSHVRLGSPCFELCRSRATLARRNLRPRLPHQVPDLALSIQPGVSTRNLEHRGAHGTSEKPTRGCLGLLDGLSRFGTFVRTNLFDCPLSPPYPCFSLSSN